MIKRGQDKLEVREVEQIRDTYTKIKCVESVQNLWVAKTTTAHGAKSRKQCMKIILPSKLFMWSNELRT